jgi:hypothetical protein
LPRTPAPAANDRVEAKVSKGLGEWLRSRNVSLLVSSYQSGRLVMIGADKIGKVVIRQERFDRAMGIAVRSDSLLLATLHQLWLFRLSRRLSAKAPDSERILIPQAGYHTGFVNCHDVAFVGAGVPVFASVLFNCVGMVTAASSFVPLWAPAFIKELVPEDRCHLNGLAVDGGRLRFVTALGVENSKQAWRQNRSQGVIFDAASKRAVVIGLLEQRLAETQLEPASAVLLFDTATSNVLYSIEFQSIVSEIYEVAFLTGTSDPRLIHPASDEAMRAYHIGALKKREPATKTLQ